MAIICKRCGNEIVGQALFCPRCGKRLGKDEMIGQTPEVIPAPKLVTPIQPAAARASVNQRPTYRLTILASLVAVAVVAGLIILVVSAFTSGLRERGQASLVEAERHYALGQVHMEAGEYQLAIAEYEYALELYPNHPSAQAGIDAVRAKLEADVVPTPAATITPKAIDVEMAALMQAYDAQNWDQVVLLGSLFLEDFPDEATDQVQGMLFEAYVVNAQVAVDEDRLGDAIRYLDQALTLNPGDEDVILMRRQAVLYQDGSSLWGADWEGAISRFEELVAIDGGYKDVYQKLYLAHTGYAAEAAENGNQCLAAAQYALASELIADDTVAGLQLEAETACLNTPTEIAPAAPGTFVGRVVEVKPSGNELIYIGGYVLDSTSKGVKAVRVMISAFDWSAIATTDSSGHYSFDGLTTPATYTLTVLDVDALPIEVVGNLKEFTQVNFEQVKGIEPVVEETPAQEAVPVVEATPTQE